MAPSSIGVAVIGAGMAGRAHAAAYGAAGALYDPSLPPIRLVAIADSNEMFATLAAQRFGYCRYETNWQTIATAKDIDVVSVVVPNAMHREVVEALLAGGKHVLCEKPLAPTLEDAEALVAAAEAAPQQTAVGFTYRTSPAINAIHLELIAGTIGRALHFSGHYWCDYACGPNAPMSWRYKGPLGSGALADLGSHLIDTAEFICGPISSVRGATLSKFVTERPIPVGAVIGHAFAPISEATEPVENEDLATFNATFVSGATATLEASRAAFGMPNALGFELFGERGAATFDLTRAGEFRFADATSPAKTNGYRIVLVGPEHPYIAGGLPMDFSGVNYGQNDLFTFQARAFLEQVAGVGKLPRCPSFREGARNLRILRAVVTSATTSGTEVVIA
jgi:predicted dehydrogenase